MFIHKKIYEFLSSDLFAKISIFTYVILVVIAEINHYVNPELFYCFPLEILGALGWGFATSEIMAFADYVLEEYIDILEDDDLEQGRTITEGDKKENSLTLKDKTNSLKATKKIEEPLDNVEYKYIIEVFFEYSVKYKLIKEELLEDWQNYLTYTIVDKDGVAWVRNLISKLVLLNTASLEEVIKKVNDSENIVSLLCHFGRNGNDLAKVFNKIDSEIKRELILN